MVELKIDTTREEEATLEVKGTKVDILLELAIATNQLLEQISDNSIDLQCNNIIYKQFLKDAAEVPIEYA